MSLHDECIFLNEAINLFNKKKSDRNYINKNEIKFIEQELSKIMMDCISKFGSMQMVLFKDSKYKNNKKITSISAGYFPKCDSKAIREYIKTIKPKNKNIQRITLSKLDGMGYAVVANLKDEIYYWED
jgi:hypothetical protein